MVAIARRLPAGLVAFLLILALPSVASATTTATRAGNAITITGDDGPNVISVNNIGDFITYEDRSGPNIVAGSGWFPENGSPFNFGPAGFGLKATITLGGGGEFYDDRVGRAGVPEPGKGAGGRQ